MKSTPLTSSLCSPPLPQGKRKKREFYKKSLNVYIPSFFVAFILLILNLSPTLGDSLNPTFEQRAQNIGKSLRCLSCQNENIENSDALLAQDMRRFVRERLQVGDTDAQVIQALVDRYGDGILFKPPFKPITWLLWLAPLAFICSGSLILTFYFNSSKKQDKTS